MNWTWSFGGFGATFMAIAGICVALPILIHLINRLRFKRIRWAAMEFLLKSQKRNRRRLIIEQLILLALRCFLILLLGLVVAGFTMTGVPDKAIADAQEKAAQQKKTNLRLVFIDDSLSMTDRWKPDEDERKALPDVKARNSYELAKEVLETKLIPEWTKNAPREQVQVYLLSDPENPIYDSQAEGGKAGKPFDAQAADQMLDALHKKDCTMKHLAPLPAVKQALTICAKPEHDDKVRTFYLLSDFREKDWGEEAPRELQETLRRLASPKEGKARVQLVDVAHQDRRDAPESPSNHENLAIVELRPEFIEVTGAESLRLFIYVHNFSSRPFKNVMCKIKVNGEERAEATSPLTDVPARATSVHVRQLVLNKEGYNLISASITDPDTLAENGLAGDNSRFAWVKMNKTLNVLVIDNDIPAKEKVTEPPKTTGSFFLKAALESENPDCRIVLAHVDELEKTDFYKYNCVYILNVPQFSKTAVQNLEKYVRQEGKGVCFFLGDKVQPVAYNNELYQDGKGIFPAPLSPKPEEDIPDFLEYDARFRRGERNLLVRDKTHPMFAPMYLEEGDSAAIDGKLGRINIWHWYSVPREQWQKTDLIEELMTLPNRKPVASYNERAQKLMNMVQLLLDTKKYDKFKDDLERHQQLILRGLLGNFTHTFQLADALDAFLNDKGAKADPEHGIVGRRGLEDFWALKDESIVKLRDDTKKLVEDTRFGDPILIAKREGRGRVVACLTEVAYKEKAPPLPPKKEPPTEHDWTDWAAQSAWQTFPIVMPALRKYLFTVTASQSLAVGESLPVDVAADGYEPEVKLYRKLDDLKDAKNQDAFAKQNGMEWLETLQAKPDGKRLKTVFTDMKTPGLYVIVLQPKTPPAAPAPLPPEQRGYAVNVEAYAEGDLRRAAQTTIEKSSAAAPASDNIKVVSGFEILVPSPGKKEGGKQDLSWLQKWILEISKSAWLYLIVLAALVAEQALAVHLSFHSRKGEVPAATLAQDQSAQRPRQAAPAA